MTGLAANIDIGPRGLVLILFTVIVFSQIGRMTIGTHVVPGLIATCPMQGVGVFDRFIGIEVKPPLSPFLFRPRVPRNS